MIFEYKDINGWKMEVNIPKGSNDIHLTWGCEAEINGIYLWFMNDNKWSLKCLSVTKHYSYFKRIESQLNKFKENTYNI